MSDLGKAYVQIVPSAQGISGSISKVLQGESRSAGESAGTTIAGKIKGVLAAAGIGTAVGTVIKKGLSEGAALEQSIGGIETLFKSSSDKMMKYANDSFKAVGLSSNEYMETVTTFSASLLQGLGGDTSKAADIANKGMVDMADNANKFGTDMGSIQNAYMGFAKQNYSMLDNLKLGYGGTQAEMYRLMSDAKELDSSFDAAFSLDEKGHLTADFNDIIEAIHIIQNDMGVTGTTAKEASTTMSGSFASMKAAATDLIANITLGNDIGPYLNNLKDTVITFAGNVLPAIGNIISAAPLAIISMIVELAPMLIEQGAQMITNLVKGLSEALPELIPAAVEAVITIAEGLIGAIPDLIDAALSLVEGLANGLVDAIPVLINSIPEIIDSLIKTLLGAIPNIIDTGVKLLTALTENLPKIIDDIVKAMPEIVTSIVKALINNMPKIIEAGVKLLTALIKNLPSIITTILTAAPKIVASIVSALGQNMPKIIEAGFKLLTALIKNLPSIITTIVRAVPQIINALLSAFRSNISSFVSAGKDLLLGLATGIAQAVSQVAQKAAEAAGKVVDAVKDKLGIASPSKVMMQIGAYMDEGLAKGIENNMSPVRAAMDELGNTAMGDFNSSFSTSTASYPAQAMSGVIINVYPREGQSEEQIAEKVNQIIYDRYVRSAEAFA